jgi:magnesium chelatase subunit I
MGFPFAAIVGQDEMKTALILNVIDPSIGGLLIAGEKGTAKSTAVRSLAELLPELRVVESCRFSCDPEGKLCGECRTRAGAGGLPEVRRRMRVVELPLGVTEDRLVGTLDLERAIQRGEKHFEAGLLGAANRNFLYVDEVNLLEDHIVDLLLDSAAMGVNTVEREGISFSHPSRFILVGTMNPEEGELRPQLLDRFGLCVRVTGMADREARREILRRKAAFDDDPGALEARWQGQQAELAGAIERARTRVPEVSVPDSVLESIVSIAAAIALDGHRGDIVMMKAARALAALRDRAVVTGAEVREAALLALPHRMRRLPFEELQAENGRLEEVLKDLAPCA